MFVVTLHFAVKRTSAWTHSSHSAFPTSPLGTCIVPSLGHTGHWCSCKDVCSLGQTFPLDSLTRGTWEKFVSAQKDKNWWQRSLKGWGNLSSRATYPDHSSLHDDREGIFAGTLRSHDHRTLLVDRRTSSHSRLHKYLGYTLKTGQDRALKCKMNKREPASFILMSGSLICLHLENIW